MADVAVEAPVRNKRNFLDEAFVADKWEAIQPYYQNLGEREIGSVAALQKWLQDWSELETAIAEYARWTYVRTTIDTRDEKAKENLMYVYAHIYPNLTACEEGLKRKFVQNPWLEQLDHEVFFTSIRRTKKDLEIFRQENIALQKEMNIKQSRFDQITGAQSITHNGEELTVQQAVACMKNTDRKLREEVFVKLAQRRLQDADTLDELLSELIQLRNQAALNAGYKNYIDFRFDELGRFDYGPADCIRFHNAVEKIAIPVMSKFTAERKKKLGIETLKPWDLEVDISGKEPLKPFANAGELIEKTINCFNLLDPYFGERISIMNKMHYLDLESRMNKGTGGYNISMPESGVPFVFMNSVNSEQDVVTMVHEGGHAIQTFLTHALSLYSFKEVTSEIAEVASMAMELLSMEHWNIFYSNPDDLKRAKKNHLQYIVNLLAKACQGDSFQFWMYDNPNHTVAERRQKWDELTRRFSPNAIDNSGHELALETGYHRILHFYIVPFYYIEYAFAQLGALAIWQNFRKNPEKSIADYKRALSYGYTKTIPAFYETAGAKFDFSEPYVASLISFLEREVSNL